MDVEIVCSVDAAAASTIFMTASTARLWLASRRNRRPSGSRALKRMIRCNARSSRD